jgi:1,4-alpha-glucan branching enzyme
VELLPIAAWIDERHLPPLGLSNAWGYNPVTMLALDPRLAPGGIADLRFAVEALHQAGIGVILDVVYNHTGESDNTDRPSRFEVSAMPPTIAMSAMIPGNRSTTPVAATPLPVTGRKYRRWF